MIPFSLHLTALFRNSEVGRECIEVKFFHLPQSLLTYFCQNGSLSSLSEDHDNNLDLNRDGLSSNEQVTWRESSCPLSSWANSGGGPGVREATRPQGNVAK